MSENTYVINSEGIPNNQYDLYIKFSSNAYPVYAGIIEVKGNVVSESLTIDRTALAGNIKGVTLVFYKDAMMIYHPEI